MTALASSLRQACERWPDSPAITFRGTTAITYAELWRRVDALAASYRRMGVRPGDRIVCQFRNCPEYVVVVAAAWECGAIHVGTDNDLTGSELAWLVDRTEAATLVFQPWSDAGDGLSALADVREVRPETKVILHDGDPEHEGQFRLADFLGAGSLGGADASGEKATEVVLGRHDTAILHLTSGTTGHPKAVRETLPGFWAKMQFFADAFHPGPDDVMLLYLPMGHVFGVRLGLMTLLAGGRLVLMERFSPGAAVEVIAEQGVTVLPGTPTHLNLILAALDGASRDVSGLRWVISAAASLPRGLTESIYKRLGVEILFVYGCSENFTTCTVDRDQILAGSVGSTVFSGPEGTPPDGRVRAVNPPDHAPLPSGEVGELAFGARRPVAYWKAPDAATDGWYYTGDLGRVDPDGQVYVLGRLNELVNRGGLKVSPTEVEAVALRHPGISDAAVVGIPDPVLGEAVCICIVPAGTPPTLLELRYFLGRSLAHHKLPDELAVVDEIPRTVIGKVSRPALVTRALADERSRQRLRRGHDHPRDDDSTTQRESRYVLDTLEEAATRSGLEWGDMEFTEPLSLFVESARRTGALNAVGRDVLHKVVIRHLRNRLAMQAFVTARPEVRVAPVRGALFITGLPRTGTTLLHNMMALDPANRVLRFWEALRPFPPDNGAGGRSEETLVAEAELWLERLHALAPYFRAIHASTATGPEECDALFQNCFASQHFDDMFRADDYSAWLAAAPLTAEYAHYRLQLRALQVQALQLRSGEGGDRRWVLKSPSHLGYLGALFETFPDATVVVCHRDPDEAAASYASLVMNVRQPYSDDVTPDVVGAHALRRCSAAMQRALAARDAVGEDAFIDVGYSALVADPVGVVRGIYERTGRTLGEDEEALIRQWLDDNPRHRHGAHRYGLAQFGLTSEAVTEGLAPYGERFGALLGSH